MTRIALFAADQVGLRIAEFLGAQSDPPVCLVLDQSDRRQINSQIIAKSGVAPDAIILTDRNTNDRLAKRLAVHAPDLCVLAWWPYILKSDVINTPKHGCLNFHPSLLPHGRGKAPNFWALVEGTPFGVTIHWVDEGIDSGDIAFQRQIPVTWQDTGKTLYEKSLQTLVELFRDSWPAIQSGEIPRKPQLESSVCHFQRELDEASRIELDGTYSGRELMNLIRARTFRPHPGAWFLEDGKRFEVQISISPLQDQQDDARAIRRA